MYVQSWSGRDVDPSSVHPQCTSSVYILSASSVYILSVHPQCTSSVYILSVHPQCTSSVHPQCTSSVHPQCILSTSSVHMYRLCTGTCTFPVKLCSCFKLTLHVWYWHLHSDRFTNAVFRLAISKYMLPLNKHRVQRGPARFGPPFCTGLYSVASFQCSASQVCLSTHRPRPCRTAECTVDSGGPLVFLVPFTGV